MLIVLNNVHIRIGMEDAIYRRPFDYGYGMRDKILMMPGHGGFLELAQKFYEQGRYIATNFPDLTKDNYQGYFEIDENYKKLCELIRTDELLENLR